MDILIKKKIFILICLNSCSFIVRKAALNAHMGVMDPVKYVCPLVLDCLIYIFYHLSFLVFRFVLIIVEPIYVTASFGLKKTAESKKIQQKKKKGEKKIGDGRKINC